MMVGTSREASLSTFHPRIFSQICQGLTFLGTSSPRTFSWRHGGLNLGPFVSQACIVSLKLWLFLSQPTNQSAGHNHFVANPAAAWERNMQTAQAHSDHQVPTFPRQTHSLVPSRLDYSKALYGATSEAVWPNKSL